MVQFAGAWYRLDNPLPALLGSDGRADPEAASFVSPQGRAVHYNYAVDCMRPAGHTK